MHHSLSAFSSLKKRGCAQTGTMWSAVFPVPRSLRAGRYTASLSNGHGPPVPIDCFVSPSLPSVRWVDIAEDAWPPPRNFSVAAFGETAPIVGRDPPGGVQDGSSRPPLPWLMPVNSTAPVLAALAAAERAGGGTVLLPGQRSGVLSDLPLIVIVNGMMHRGQRACWRWSPASPSLTTSSSEAPAPTSAPSTSSTTRPRPAP